MIPTRTQWKKWSLPSRLTAIGTYVGIIGLVLAVVFFVADFGGSDPVVYSTPRIASPDSIPFARISGMMADTENVWRRLRWSDCNPDEGELEVYLKVNKLTIDNIVLNICDSRSNPDTIYCIPAGHWDHNKTAFIARIWLHPDIRKVTIYRDHPFLSRLVVWGKWLQTGGYENINTFVDGWSKGLVTNSMKLEYSNIATRYFFRTLDPGRDYDLSITHRFRNPESGELVVAETDTVTYEFPVILDYRDLVKKEGPNVHIIGPKHWCSMIERDLGYFNSGQARRSDGRSYDGRYWYMGEDRDIELADYHVDDIGLVPQGMGDDRKQAPQLDHFDVKVVESDEVYAIVIGDHTILIQEYANEDFSGIEMQSQEVVQDRQAVLEFKEKFLFNR